MLPDRKPRSEGLSQILPRLEGILLGIWRLLMHVNEGKISNFPSFRRGKWVEKLFDWMCQTQSQYSKLCRLVLNTTIQQVFLWNTRFEFFFLCTKTKQKNVLSVLQAVVVLMESLVSQVFLEVAVKMVRTVRKVMLVLQVQLDPKESQVFLEVLAKIDRAVQKVMLVLQVHLDPKESLVQKVMLVLQVQLDAEDLQVFLEFLAFLAKIVRTVQKVMLVLQVQLDPKGNQGTRDQMDLI